MKKILMLENLPYVANIKIGSHHYAENFSCNNKVMWISLPWHFFQLLKDRKSDRIKNWNFNKVNTKGNLFYHTPFTIIPYRNNIILKNKFILENYYKIMFGLYSNIKKYGFDDVDILWFTDPRHISLLKKIKAKKIIYRCVDDLEAFNDIPKNLIKYEIDLIKTADFVFYTSEKLLNKYKHYNLNSFYLPNGCDYEHFQNENFVELEIIKNNFSRIKPNVIYVGTIGEWFDWDIVKQITEKNCNVILCGPVRTNVPSDIKSNKDINFVGVVKYDELPNLFYFSDIGIIPFKINNITNSVNPIKLYEYCAAGLPVISTAFETIKNIKGPFKLLNRENNNIENLIEWAKFIKNKKEEVQKIKAFARNNSWKARAEMIFKIIGDKNENIS